MLQVEIITPEQTAFEGEVDSITLPSAEGELTILAHHMPLITIIKAGSVLLRTQRKEQLFAISKGVAEIEGTRVRLLTDTADRAEQLDEEAIEKAREEAKRMMSETRHDTEGFAIASALLERELARLNVVRRHRSRFSAGFSPSQAS